MSLIRLFPCTYLCGRPVLPSAFAMRTLPGLLLAAALFAVAAPGAFAAEPQILKTDDRQEALAGELDGVSVGPLGELEPAPRLDRLIGLDEPFVFAAASAERGWILGTGNEGKVFFVNREGGTRVVARLPEPEVFAVHGASDGSILAAGSPSGKVFRIRGGELEELFDPEATYVWALGEDGKGRVLAATGLPGRLLRFDGKNTEVLYESPDAHVRSMLIAGDGSVYLGTAGQGLIVRLDPSGKVRTLYDADEPEVLAFAEGGGRIYAALLASEASYVDLSSGGEEEEGDAPASANPTIGSRAGDHEGPRSVVLALREDGSVEPLARLQDETVHAMAYFEPKNGAGGLWIGTGQEGHLYRLQGDELIREAELPERQLIALAEGPGAESGRSLGVVTTNSVAVYRLDGSRRDEGTYTSKIHDLGGAADLGVFRWRGDLPPGADVRASFRTGMSKTPDATWTDWSEARKVDVDQELSLRGLAGRFLQWRLNLRRGEAADLSVRATELSYRQRNRAPTVDSLTVEPPGLILVPQSFNPTSTTFEPWTPNKDGIFTSVRKERETGTLKTLWKKGYRTVRWEASDPDGDDLKYVLEVRREGVDGPWTPIVEDLEDTWFSFDSMVLPDGVYRFRLVAHDGEGNEADRRLVTREVSEPVIVDHSPPELVSREAQGGVWMLDVRDAATPLADVSWSVDAGPWQSARAADGLLDSRRERLEIDLPEGARWVLLRLTDGAHNVVTLDLSNR